MIGRSPESTPAGASTAAPDRVNPTAVEWGIAGSCGTIAAVGSVSYFIHRGKEFRADKNDALAPYRSSLDAMYDRADLLADVYQAINNPEDEHYINGIRFDGKAHTPRPTLHEEQSNAELNAEFEQHQTDAWIGEALRRVARAENKKDANSAIIEAKFTVDAATDQHNTAIAQIEGRTSFYESEFVITAGIGIGLAIGATAVLLAWKGRKVAVRAIFSRWGKKPTASELGDLEVDQKFNAIVAPYTADSPSPDFDDGPK
jgi:hypothetical protein